MGDCISMHVVDVFVMDSTHSRAYCCKNTAVCYESMIIGMIIRHTTANNF